MNKKSTNLFFITFLVAAILVLSGCSIKTPFTEVKLTKEFNNNTVSLLKVRQIAAEKEQAKGKKNTEAFIKRFNRDAKAEQKKVDQSVKTLQDSKKFSGYPENVQDYSVDVLNYIKTVINDKSVKTQTKAYHKTATSAIKIASEKSDKKTKSLVTSIVQNDAVMQAKTITKNNKNSDSKNNIQNLKKKPFKTHIININLGWGIILILISGLLIATIFMQPNKSEDMTKALTDENSMPKPRGYALFLVRSTEILTIMLAVVLILMNRIS
ncbi:preprotein translocase subunit SecG [Lactobacillus sp. ESL0230]|uniref:preprotein translocase subunit SecG n=1 Tax=Lactobacillus sp. ESL0230 TaxID=2069353 RepID=UPI000EFD7196|nr:preprotein translocase subunit SecG [Lactobacillus sp. ESL0230]RMC46712.1 preprotein translocase subunit SecG [Lactobacillus sp. ESL0230]